MAFLACGLHAFRLGLLLARFGKIYFQIYPFAALHWLFADLEKAALHFLAAASLLGFRLASGPAQLLLS